MGMFDTIRCAYPLPDPADQGGEFRTKSLDCLLDEYRITTDGLLLRNTWIVYGMKQTSSIGQSPVASDGMPSLSTATSIPTRTARSRPDHLSGAF